MKHCLITLWLDSDNIVNKCSKHSKICTTLKKLQFHLQVKRLKFFEIVKVTVYGYKFVKIVSFHC